MCLCHVTAVSAQAAFQMSDWIECFGSVSSSSSSSPSPLTCQETAQYLLPDDAQSGKTVSTASSLRKAKEQCDAPPDELGKCYGGTLLGLVYEQCETRVKGHKRGEVCARHHAFIKCIQCGNVLHAGCWTVDANLNYILPTKKFPWTCHECLLSPRIEAITGNAGGAATPTATGGTLIANVDNAVEDAEDDDTSELVKSTFLMTKDDLVKEFMKSGWKIRSSDATNKHARIYFHCQGKKCQSKFSAREEKLNEWIVTDMPSTHACANVRAPTGLIDKRCDIPSAVLDKIKELGMGYRGSRIFEGPAIREFIRVKYNCLIEVSLIHSICYQAKTLVFGESGDTIALGIQQTVMVAKLMYTQSTNFQKTNMQLPCYDRNADVHQQTN
jgi:hypothetical protein